jgi:S-adenosylmethionine/arginine decarboxylase-like enzyme
MQTRPSPDPGAPGSSAEWGLATADVSGVSPERLDDPEWLTSRLSRALAGALGPFEFRHHRFAPGGVSLIGTATAARVVVHTWPERTAVTVDLYAASSSVEQLLQSCLAALTGELT